MNGTLPQIRSVAATLLVLTILTAPAQAQLRSAAPGPSVAAVPAPVLASPARTPLAQDPTPVRAPAAAQDRWIAMDKAKHLGGSTLLTLSAQYVLVTKANWSDRDALPVSAGAAATIGLGKEIYDRYAGPTRYFSKKDLVADAIGILLGAGVILL
jgi:uncharacterized protein YfiM (DUF2279 family)